MSFNNLISMCITLIVVICFTHLSNAVKPGTCPTAPSGTITTCLASCNADEECSGYQKCCHYGCGIRCLNPIINRQKPGRCPVPPNGVITTCDVMCDNDDSCPGFQKCCHYGCRIACYNPM